MSRYLRAVALAIAVALVQVGPVLAKPDFGPQVDAWCTAEGRDPATPYADLANPADPFASCTLCHQAGSFPTGGTVTPAGREFKNGNFAVYCPNLAAVNRPPVIDPIPPRSVGVGDPVMIAVTAADPDGDALVLAAAGSPRGASFTDRGDGTGLFQWVPGPDQVGSHRITFSATDDGVPMLTAQTETVLTVGSANRPPALEPIGSQVLDVGTLFELVVRASDPDGDSLTLGADPLPRGATFTDRGDGTGRFAWTPGPGDAGNHTVTFTVLDGGVPMGMDSETVTLTVGQVNRPPVLDAIGNRSVRVGESLEILVTATDPDGDALRLEAAGLPPGALFEDYGDGTGALRWSPAEPGEFPVTVAVTDSGLPRETTAETFLLRADPPPPVGDLVVLRAEARRHPRGRHAHLRVEVEGAEPGARVALVDAATGAVLGARRADEEGRVRGRVRLPLVPCEVVAVAGELRSAPFPVAGDVDRCGAELFLRVKELEWECEHGGRLELRGDRAPLHATLLLTDWQTGEVLLETAADRRGRFRGRAAIPVPPASVRLEVRAGSGTWELGALSVERDSEGCRDERCEPCPGPCAGLGDGGSDPMAGRRPCSAEEDDDVERCRKGSRGDDAGACGSVLKDASEVGEHRAEHADHEVGKKKEKREKKEREERKDRKKDGGRKDREGIGHGKRHGHRD